jgi:DNA-binding CsgD family transcriptional regulator
MAPLIAQAHQLTARESEICLLVLRGLSTAEMAEHLHITPNTVQDHLKAIFEKTGVHSRLDLLSQIFFNHYWPIHASATNRPAQPTN